MLKKIKFTYLVFKYVSSLYSFKGMLKEKKKKKFDMISIQFQMNVER